ncbi:hypothetical protein MLD38_009099 [Melastoma candidum]|uniref:Uncharacterized protein n=1 Tax=Melastoma candidum TaxID=119954 RepID=A0ACB9RWE8_9MYRT|nr:hypothetical protein MLD38_009099 [Melastoma candidum]
MAPLRPPALFIVLALLLILGVVDPVTEAKIPAVIVFGDSSVDSGNNNVIATILKSNFEPYGRDFYGGRPTGRFSNGRVPPDFISEAFGIKASVPAYLDPAYKISDFTTGVCFASAGTGYDNTTSHVLNVIPLWKELEYYKEYQEKLRQYLGKDQANYVLSEALYIVSLGTNDFLENYYLIPVGVRRAQFSLKQYKEFLVGLASNFIREIHALGARKISLTGLPPMGCLPLERTANFFRRPGSCNEEYNTAAKDFNGKLRIATRKLNKELPGLKMVLSDPYDLFLQIITKPSSFGFEVAERACCGTGFYEMSYLCNKHSLFTCMDASKFVFWDSFHPTERTNKILSDALLKSVLLPAFS